MQDGFTDAATPANWAEKLCASIKAEIEGMPEDEAHIYTAEVLAVNATYFDC